MEGREFREQMMDYVDSGRKLGEESHDSLNLNSNLKIVLIDGRFEVAWSGTPQSICLEKSIITTGIWCLRTFQSPLRTEIVGTLAECVLRRIVSFSLLLSVFPAAMPSVGGERVPAVFGVAGDGRFGAGVSVGVGTNALPNGPRYV